jgi:gas vesicle protein
VWQQEVREAYKKKMEVKMEPIISTIQKKMEATIETVQEQMRAAIKANQEEMKAGLEAVKATVRSTVPGTYCVARGNNCRLPKITRGHIGMADIKEQP